MAQSCYPGSALLASDVEVPGEHCGTNYVGAVCAAATEVPAITG